MKLITDVFEKSKRPEFKKFAELKQRGADSLATRNKLFIYQTEMEAKVVEANQLLFNNQTVEALDAFVAIREKHRLTAKALSEIATSLGIHAQEIYDTDEATEILKDALKAYADELSKRINAIMTDAQALADKSGIPFSEPAACSTLRLEMGRASDGMEACRQYLSHEADLANTPWTAFAGLIRIGAGAYSLPN